MRSYLLFAIILLASLTFGALILVSVAPYLPGADVPVQFRIYHWQSGVFFSYLLAALAVFAVSRMLFAYGYVSGRDASGRPSAWNGAATGLALAALLVSLSGFELDRPQRLDWTALRAETTPGEAAAPNAPDAFWLPQQVRRSAVLGREEGRPVLYYVYADWCPSCPDFEKFVLGSPQIRDELQEYIKVKLDVSDYDRWGGYVEKTFRTHGVPALAVRDRSGKILPRSITGEHVAMEAVRSLLRAGLETEPRSR